MKKKLIMHDMPSVTYEDSYKRRGKPWKRGLFLGPYGWMDETLWEQWLWSYSEFGEVEDLERGLLSQGVLSSTS